MTDRDTSLIGAPPAAPAGDVELVAGAGAEHPETLIDQDDGQEPDEPADLDDDQVLEDGPA